MKRTYKESPEKTFANSNPATCGNRSSLTEPPARTPDEEIEEMISVSKTLLKLEADEARVFALILICCLTAVAACVLKLVW